MDPIWLLLIGTIVVIGGVLVLRLPAFLALVLGGLIVAALTPAGAIEKFALGKKQSEAEAKKLAQTSVGERLAREFGSTCAKIGLLIAFASIIGKCLMDSGGADRIVRALMRRLGEPRAPVAFLAGSYLLGIPIFFETVFLLMVPLAKALWLRTRRNYVLYLAAIIAGGTMTHSLVPPTPGPLFVATELHVDIGLMMLMGCLVSAITGAAGCLYGVWINRRLPVPVREIATSTLAELEAVAQRDERELPPLWLALAPILLPVVLIGGNAVLPSASRALITADPAGAVAKLDAVFNLLGESNLALLLSAMVALWMLARQQRARISELGPVLSGALQEAGSIILIIAAGGAFGGVLQQTGIGARIQELTGGSQAFVLPVAWLMTALIRAAQGSATVAMITGAGMFGALATSAQLGFHPVYLALAIGCGSKPLPWMNDSGFWVVCKLSGLTERETLKTFTTELSVMGVVGLGVVLVLAKLFPMT